MTCDQLDIVFLQQIASKANEIEAKINSLVGQSKKVSFGTSLKIMETSIKSIVFNVTNNLIYLNSTELFKEDFFNSIYTINKAVDSFLSIINSIRSLQKDIDLIYVIQKNIVNFSKSISIYSSILEEIFACYSKTDIKNEDDMNMINNRIGIESVLFNFSVNVQQTNEYPYLKSNFIEVYHFYHKINQMSKPITAIESFCGTGKTLCIPMILMCRSLKDKMNFPFCILSQPSPKHVESKEKFFTQKLSKYVNVLSDSNELIKVYNEFEKNSKCSKLVFGLVTHYSLLPLLYNLRKISKLYSNTRFIIDELHQRTIYLDVLLSKIATLYMEKKVFNMPIHVTLMSASFSPEVLKPFKNQIEMNQLVKHSLFEIYEAKPIIERNIYKINNIIMPNEAVKVMREMSNINSYIEEGNILCFLSGIGNCNKLKKSIYSMLRNSNETKYNRKVVILQTTLKPKEKIENYFQRLKLEYELNEGIREGKNYQYEFLYFIPLVLSGIVEDTVYQLTQEEFPGELKKINKFICSTPMLQSSFTIDKLSVVIDSGLAKEAEFDIFTGLTSLNEKQVSFEIMNQRKGRLGRTMNGMYVSIRSPQYLIPQNQISPIEKVDLTNHILFLKNIGIDIEKLKNLPSNPDDSILDFTMDNMSYIGAIDPKTNEITPFGKEILNFPFISFYYAAAALKYKDSFEKENRSYALFIAVYISLIITMDSILVQEDFSEKLSRSFREDSDIVTLIYALNSLILSDVTDINEKRNLVESYGFSYSSFLTFLDNMKTMTDLLFPGKTTAEIIQSLGSFVRKVGGIPEIIDNFILSIIKVYPHWKKIHSIEMKYVSGTGGFESRPTFVFQANDRLKFENQKNPNSEVRISSRPGWNGIGIPSECYCFNITRNLNSNVNIGRLVHRKSKTSNSCISYVECDKSALNPWFDVLLLSYFSDRHLNIRYFCNNINKTEQEKRMFHISNVEDRVFVSFMPLDNSIKNEIVEGIKNCLLLLPFTPRSVVVLRSDIKSLIEIKSIGTQHYETTVLTNQKFQRLNRYNFGYCINNLDLLAKSDSPFRICCLFIDNCKLNQFNQKELFLISPSTYEFPFLRYIRLMYIVDLFNEYNQNVEQNEFDKISNDSDELELFQFPIKFIHPALMYNQESFSCIMKWFNDYCDYAHVVKVIGHRLLIKTSEIQKLQYHIRIEKKEILKQMNLNLVAIPVPKKIYQRAYLTIKEHPTWNYDNRFKVIITSKKDENEVKSFLNQIKKEIDTENQQINTSEENNETLCCLYICEDPDFPTLTKYPITIYNKDGSSYTNKMCRDCLYSSLEIATESFYSNGEINQEALQKITVKPAVIPSVESNETEDSLECWPQIPLGQMISALINNDDEMSSLISAWLNGVVEFTIRNQSKHLFSFCPDHPQKIISIRKIDRFDIYCHVPSCRNLFCTFCQSWHNDKFV